MRAKVDLDQRPVYLVAHRLRIHKYRLMKCSSLGWSTYGVNQMEVKDALKYRKQMVLKSVLNFVSWQSIDRNG